MEKDTSHIEELEKQYNCPEDYYMDMDNYSDNLY